MEKRKKKEKSGKEKVKRRFSAGGVVFKKIKTSNGKVITKWLVTKSTPSVKSPKSTWRLPKGWLDDENEGNTPGQLTRGDRKAEVKELQKAAVREVREEGGVEAKIIEKIGTDRYFFTLDGENILKFVTYYLMKYVKDAPEGYDFETEEVEWLFFKTAQDKLTNLGEKKVLEKAKKLLSSKVRKDLI